MKRIRYIRPTSRSTEAAQRLATDHLGPFALTVVDGKEGRTFETALKLIKTGNALTIAEFETLARRIDTRCRLIEQVFDKGGLIEDADGDIHRPEARSTLLKALRTRREKQADGKPRVAHNKADQEVRDRAEELWTGANYANMTNGQIADEVGVTIKTLMQWFGPRGRRAGRPWRK
jgi:hypothetical protein